MSGILPPQQSYAVILHPYWKTMAGCQLLRSTIVTAQRQFPMMERRLLVRHILLHCKYQLRIVFYRSEADGEVATQVLATDHQVESFLAMALQEGFDMAMARMDDNHVGFLGHN